MSTKKYIKKRANLDDFTNYCIIRYNFIDLCDFLDTEFVLKDYLIRELAATLSSSQVVSVDVDFESHMKLDSGITYYRPVKLRCIHDHDKLHIYWSYRPISIYKEVVL